MQTALLAEFVRAHRERLSPAQAGLPAGLRRRAKGLRREELAALCDISPTWLTWIEQGRAPSVSAAALARIADALQLTRAERDYLFCLAGVHDPAGAAAASAHAAQATLEKAVHGIRGAAYVIDRDWDALAWNRAAGALFAGWLDRRATERNLLRYMFLVPAARQLVEDWPGRAARVVAEFRADAGGRVDDPALRQRLDALRRESREFEDLWRRQDVMAREGGERIFLHPKQGRLAMHQLTLRVANAPDLKLVMLL